MKKLLYDFWLRPLVGMDLDLGQESARMRW